MRPFFRDLANPELLKKCLHGGTQNPNESVNNVIWSRVPKKTFAQLQVLSLGIQETGMWRRRSNFELYQSNKELDIVNFIKIQGIKWAGYVAKMEENRTTKKYSMPNQFAQEERAG
ncbi:uncharacterized protein TNCV_3546321 [Trichonephila clavipes]|nr:uncharacterized protein TNCV_3546321 [Trichonephila clavipes]